MSVPRTAEAGSFFVLTEEQCWRLLEQHTAGRVGWLAADGPSILPVNYAVGSGTIYFRTSDDGELSRLSRRSRVAFEVDGIDETTGSGWSVLVRGSAEHVQGTFMKEALWRDGPVPWARGRKTLFIAITPESVSGRRVQSPDFA